VACALGQKRHGPRPGRAARRSRQLGAALGGRPSSCSELDQHGFRGPEFTDGDDGN
jgi:hypothetical protein